jgi:exodeoxyribonuclease-1
MQNFFFYDLETTGTNPREGRIMQFAGQRTDMDLNPVGEPVDVMIRLTPDVLPEPDAIMITGITPQQTLQDGLTEAEFLQYFYKEVVKPSTIFVGFNSVRFDDEFMRFLHYRNFYDAYEWQWCDDCSRWDILDVVRMTRALRPEGIEWPVTPEGKPTNRLELLTKLNGVDHQHAHDALNDVMATIAVTKLIRDKQPDLYKYLLEGRGKKDVKKLVQQGKPFVYTSGKYSSQWLHTTMAVLLADHPAQDCALVYDLRFDPTEFMDKTPEQLAEAWRYTRDPDAKRLPVKTLKYNRCPAIAPPGVMNKPEIMERLQLTMDTVEANLVKLRAGQAEFAGKVLAALDILDRERADAQAKAGEQPVDGKLYDGFFSDRDKQQMRSVRQATPQQLSAIKLDNDRLAALLPLYKARNFPAQLTTEERQVWDSFCHQRLTDGGTNSRLARYGQRLQELAAEPSLDQEKRYLLEELQLYAQSIIP